MKLFRRLRTLFRKGKLDAEMAEEMRLHLEMQAARNRATGMGADEARYAAQREFGNVASLQERCREQRGWVWLEQFGQDLRYAARQLFRAKGFTAVVVLTLALGIGATTAIYSVVDAVLFHPIPGPDADRVVQIGEWLQASNRLAPDRGGLSSPIVRALIEAEHEFFDEVVWCDGLQLDRRGEEFSTLLFGEAVSENFFPLLGVRPALGRGFAPGEAVSLENHLPDRDTTIVLSDAWWRSEFAADPDVLGRTVELGGKRFIVIGVMPAFFQFPQQSTKFWIPAELVRPNPRSVSQSNIRLVARLKPHVSIEQAQVMLDTLVQRLLEEYPADKRGYGASWRKRPGGLRLWVLPLREAWQNASGGRMDDLRRTLFGFLAAIGFVLVIVCVNVANLMLARTERRQHELAVRAALGAGRFRLARQLLTESLLLSGLGGGLGLVVARWSMDVFAAFNTMPRLRPVTIDTQVLAWTLLVALVTGLAFGLLPAWLAGRTGLREGLARGGPSSSTGRQGARMRSGLVVAEVALAVVLLTGAGLMIRSVVRLLHVDPGFDPVNLATVELGSAGFESTEREKKNAFVAELRARMAGLPGVTAAGIFKRDFSRKCFLEFRPDPVLLTGAWVGVEDSDYFRTTRIPLLAGRLLGREDVGEGIRTVVVNETLAQLCWPGQSAIGKRFRREGLSNEPPYEVVGVVGDVRTFSLDAATSPMFFRPFAEAGLTGGSDTLVMRVQTDPRVLVPAIRREIRTLRPGIREPWIEVAEQRLYDSTAAQRTYRNYLVVFASVGLLLAMLGIYGVLAYAVACRTREVGIRLTLGADRLRIMSLILGEGARMIGIGTVVGLVAGFWLTKLLQRQLFGVSPHDPIVHVSVIILLTLVGLLASWLPARRAAKVDPMVALRAE